MVLIHRYAVGLGGEEETRTVLDRYLSMLYL